MQRQTTPYASTNTGHKKPLIVVLLVLTVILIALALNRRVAAPAVSTSTKHTTAQAAPTTRVFDKKAQSLSDPASIWVVINKQHPINPLAYVPQLTDPNVPLKSGHLASNMQVSKQMAGPLESMFTAASNEGYHLMLSSGYRSYAYQVEVYRSIVSSAGQGSADEQSARPGYSEHQTGFAADVAPLSGKCDLSQCFGQTPEGQWLAANAYKYGFIVRYPAGKQAITGYEYEPWHIRYVGVALATEMHTQGITTLEEFFNIGGGGTYN